MTENIETKNNEINKYSERIREAAAKLDFRNKEFQGLNEKLMTAEKTFKKEEEEYLGCISSY